MKAKMLIPLVLILAMTFKAVEAQNAGYTVRGRVTDENSEPLAGAGIRVINTVLGTYSGNNGEYSVTVKGPGVYTMVFSFTGYKNSVKEITVEGNVNLDITLSLSPVITEEIIVSATRAGSKTPVAYTNVESEDIRKQNNGRDIPYLLGLTPSLVETSEAGTGIGYTSLRIRGTDANRINVTIDGIPLNDAESQQVFWVDIPDLASSVSNIQVQRGVGTSSNGAGAFGASLNIQTKSPEDEPFAEISSSGGSFNTLKNTVSAGTGLLSGRFAVQMRYSDVHSDGYIKRSGSDNRSAAFTGVYKSDRSLLKTNIIIGEEHTGISWWGVPAEMLPSDRRYNPAGEYEDESGETKYYDNESDNYRQNHYQLIYTLNINRFLNLHAAFHYTHGEGYYEEYREDQLYSDYGLPPLMADTALITSTDMIRRKWMSNDFYGIIYSLKYTRKKIDAVIGGGANIYDGDHFGHIIWMQNAGTTDKDYQWYLNRAEKSEINIYGKLNYRFSSRLSGFADLQYRHISYEMSGPDDDFKDLTQSHTFSFLNPKAGLFWSVAPSQDAYISFSVANREPARSDFKEASGDPGVTPRPETLYDAEAGYSLKTGNLNIGINLYGMFYKDQLIPTGELSDVGYPVMTNVKKSSRTGFEFTVSWEPAEVITWNMGLTISRNRIPDFTGFYTDYSTVDLSSEYRSKDYGNVDIAYSPSVIGISALALNITEKFSLHLTGKYVGKQYFDNTMSINRKLDPYLVSNLAVSYKAAIRKVRELEATLYINNILNSKYVSNGYGGLWYKDGVEQTWAYYFPQAGANFLVRLAVKF